MQTERTSAAHNARVTAHIAANMRRDLADKPVEWWELDWIETQLLRLERRGQWSTDHTVNLWERAEELCALGIEPSVHDFTAVA